MCHNRWMLVIKMTAQKSQGDSDFAEQFILIKFLYLHCA